MGNNAMPVVGKKPRTETMHTTPQEISEIITPDAARDAYERAPYLTLQELCLINGVRVETLQQYCRDNRDYALSIHRAITEGKLKSKEINWQLMVRIAEGKVEASSQQVAVIKMIHDVLHTKAIVVHGATDNLSVEDDEDLPRLPDSYYQERRARVHHIPLYLAREAPVAEPIEVEEMPD